MAVPSEASLNVVSFHCCVPGDHILIVKPIDAYLDGSRSDMTVVRETGREWRAMKRAARQVCQQEIGKKPEVTVVISRLS